MPEPVECRDFPDHPWPGDDGKKYTMRDCINALAKWKPGMPDPVECRDFPNHPIPGDDGSGMNPRSPGRRLRVAEERCETESKAEG